MESRGRVVIIRYVHPSNLFMISSHLLRPRHLASGSLATPDASVSYWQMTQVPTATSGPPLQMGLPAEPIHYPPSYHSQVLSPTEHRNAVTGNDFQAGNPCAPVLGTTYGTTSMMYTERPDATALTAPGPPTALSTSAQHLPIVHDQGGSGHNRIPQEVVIPSLSYEVSSHKHPADNEVRFKARVREIPRSNPRIPAAMLKPAYIRTRISLQVQRRRAATRHPSPCP